MSVGVQKVVVFQDASRDVNWSIITWVLHGFSLKPGDELTVLAVLHLVNNHSIPFMGAKKKNISSPYFLHFSDHPEAILVSTPLHGPTWKMALNAKNKFGLVDGSITKPVPNQVEIKTWGRCDDMVLSRIIVSIGKKFTTSLWVNLEDDSPDIKFNIEVCAGLSPKEVALTGAISLRATWVILDRQMKKDKKYFMEKLSCGISRMKHDNTIKQLRGPKEMESRKLAENKSKVSYEDMIPEIPEEEFSPQRMFCSTYNEQEKQHNDRMGGSVVEQDVFEISICLVCNNRRPQIGWRRDFTYVELHEATEGFSSKNLSEGRFGYVYKGELKNGLKVSIKQYKYASFQGEKEFKSEVNVLSKARHENLVMLLGSCSQGSHRLLVYEYVCNGSLDQHLSNREYNRRPLSWDNRLKIALGAAKGLEYLHNNNIIHRDMRPNNILVTHDHKSLLGDFGLARTQYLGSDHSSETSVVGILGYVAPEYAERGEVSTKTDIYSFGVVLLQLITGLSMTDKKLGGRSLVGWARPLLREKNYPNLIDQRIEDANDVHQLFWMVRVVEKCLSKDPNKRLDMTKVVIALSYIIEATQPVPTTSI